MDMLNILVNDLILNGVHVIIEDSGIEFNAPPEIYDDFDLPTAIAEENQIEHLVKRI